MSMATIDTAPVRVGEELSVGSLSEYLRDKMDAAERGVTVEQFPDGHSNLTYLVRAGGREYVLRRGPLGPVAAKAHDMAREYRVLEAVHPHFPQAPQVFHMCEDPSVLGAAFFLMERRQGVILRDRIPPEVATIPDYARQVSQAFIDCLVRLHAIDIAGKGLTALGKPEGFVERQVRGWAERWNRAKTKEMPEMDRVIQWLADRLPTSPAPTLVHNDYKLDNVMLPHGSVDRIEAVLDWEMATVGDPLADLGLTLCYWSWLNVSQLQTNSASAITAQPGWYTREQFLQRYEERTGRDLTHIGYYEVLGIFKLSVVLQQIYYRFHRGQTKDVRFRNFDERVDGLVTLAARLTGQYS
jgi:aminoglycoside phosphotransferase (APT) family kinase protein